MLTLYTILWKFPEKLIIGSSLHRNNRPVMIITKLVGEMKYNQVYTCEIKLHYLNATASTCEEMIKRVVFAIELGVLIKMHDYLTCMYTTPKESNFILIN